MADSSQGPATNRRTGAGLDAMHRQPLIGQWVPRLELGGTTKYAALAQAIELGISEGFLQPGMRLPPQRDIAKYLGVTIATVTKAIGLATHRGLVAARAGSGTFIVDRNAAQAAPAAVPDADIETQDLSLNAPPVSVVMDLLQENLRELAHDGPATNRAFDYEPIPGEAAHRQAACKWMALRGLAATPDQVLITQGAHEALLVCLSALTQPGDTVLCERLNYTGLRRIGQLLRIKLVGVEVDDGGLLVDTLPDLIRRHSPKAIVCTPVTHNPTTVTYSERCKALLGKLAEAAAIPIIEDDIYGLFGGSDAPPLAASWPDSTILVTSLSKTIAAGLRVGYVSAPASLLPRIRDALFMLGWTAPALQMSFATRLIDSGRAERCVALHRAEATQRVQMAKRILGSALRTSSSTPTYHVWVETGTMRPGDISAELYRQGIQVSPASHFVIGDGPVPQALRLSLGRAHERQALELPLRLIAHRLSAGKTPALGSIA